jgi:hypothetical protein
MSQMAADEKRMLAFYPGHLRFQRLILDCSETDVTESPLTRWHT